MFNPSQDLLFTDRTSLVVPCGECEACRQERKNSYYARIIYVLAERPKEQYINGFLTLTFNDEHLPTTTMCDSNGEEYSFSCFDSMRVRKFFRQLYKAIYKKFGECDIKWIACPEYGEHTRRPHYHTIISVKRHHDDTTNFTLTVDYLYTLFNRYWVGRPITNEYGHVVSTSGNGFVAPSSPFVHTVEQDYKYEIDDCGKSARYTSKYCLKEKAYYDMPHIKAMEQTYREYRKLNDEETDTLYIDWCKKYRQVMPKVLMSAGFGAEIDKIVLNSDDPVDTLSLGVKDFGRQGQFLRIPAYNRRRLLTKTHLYKEFRPKKKSKYIVRYDKTELGKEYFRRTLDSKITNLASSLHMFYHNPSQLQQDYIKTHSTDLYKTIRNCFNTTDDFRKLAIYSIVYRDRPFGLYAYNILDHTAGHEKLFFDRSIDIDTLCNNASLFATSSLDTKKFINSNEILSTAFKDEQTKFNSLDCFKHYETCLCYYEDYQKQTKPQIYLAKAEEFAEQNRKQSAWKNYHVRDVNLLQNPIFKFEISASHTFPLEEQNLNTTETLTPKHSYSTLYKYARLRNTALREKSAEFRLPTGELSDTRETQVRNTAGTSCCTDENTLSPQNEKPLYEDPFGSCEGNSSPF